MLAMATMKIAQLRYSERMNSVAPSWMMAPIYTMPSDDLKLMLCSSSSREWLLPRGTSLIWAKFSQAHPAPTAAANTINTIKNHINYTQTRTITTFIFRTPLATTAFISLLAGQRVSILIDYRFEWRSKAKREGSWRRRPNCGSAASGRSAASSNDAMQSARRDQNRTCEY